MLWNLNTHETKLEELINQAMIEYAFFVHFFDLGTNAFIGELAHVVTEQKFIFSKRNQRLGRGNLWSCYLGHAKILKKTEFSKLKIVTLVSARVPLLIANC